MTAINLTALSDKIMCVESPVSVVEGETITFSVTFWGAATTSSTIVYRNQSSTAVTATIMPSGSQTESGNVVTLKPATAFTGGSRYIFAVTATVAGNVRVRKFMVICAKDEKEG